MQAELKELQDRLAELFNARLDAHEIAMNGRLDGIRDRIETIQTRCHGHAQALFGDDSDGKPGIKLRVDRLEQRQKINGLLGLAALSAALTAVGKIIVDWFGGHGRG